MGNRGLTEASTLVPPVNMSPPQQKALIIPINQGQFVIGPVDIPKPGPDQLLIKIFTAGLNPVDWQVHQRGFPPASYLAVLGMT